MKLRHAILILVIPALLIACEKRHIPTVQTFAVTEIDDSSGLGNGLVVSDGGAEVAVKGVCWSLHPHPTVYDSANICGRDTGKIASRMRWLIPETTYYVRAYASNTIGEGYGEEVQFTTLKLPVVETYAVTEISDTTATGGGFVHEDGGKHVTAKGVCWSIHVNPTIHDSINISGSDTGTIVSVMRNLTAGTNYYVKAFATTSIGTGYGQQVQFTTTGK